MAEYSAIYEDAVDRITAVYNSCSIAEQKLLKSILEEMSVHGYSQTLEQTWLSDFREVPVSLNQFLDDPDYLGHATDMGKSVFPYWRQMMNDLFNAGNRYNEVILSGATRIGKTSTAITIMAYMLYRLMLYRDPHSYFSQKPTARFTLVFANLTKELATGVAFFEFNSTIKESPWFLRHGSMNRSSANPIYLPDGDKINILPCSDAAHALGMQVFAAIMDEVSFAKAGIKDITKAKASMKNMYDTINARISGTFRIGGEVYGKLIASSSKNQDNDFLADHIETQQRADNEHLFLVDEPQWKILPKEKFSDKVFHFTVGDRYKRGFVIPEENDDEEHRKEYEEQGYKVIEAPAELRKNFVADYDIALRDIAGISVAGAMGFITQEMVTPCVTQERQNPFYEDVLVIGTRDEGVEISDYFHEEAVPSDLKVQQMAIHIDLAETRNRTGISGCVVSGNKVVETEDGKKVALPYIKQVFAVGVEAPRGDRQSFQKVINFIVYLRQHHFNIGTISTDQYQSSFLRETLSQQGFDVTKFSVTGSMDPFIGMKNLLIDQRIELVKNQVQEDELVSVQRVNNKIEIPESSDGGHGDIAESAVGAAYSLVKDQVTARPPARNLASIAAAVNTGRGGRRPNPMSSANTINSGPKGNYPVKFPKLR